MGSDCGKQWSVLVSSFYSSCMSGVLVTVAPAHYDDNIYFFHHKMLTIIFIYLFFLLGLLSAHVKSMSD
jgi:hypothetical protein